MTVPRVGGYADQWHRYYWAGVGPMPGVTSILKLQDALIGGDLAAWGGGIAADYVLGRFRDRENPPTAEEFLNPGLSLRTDALRAVSAKRDIGSAVHGKIEDLLSGKVWNRTPETGLYLDGFSLFMADHHPEFIETEQMIFHPGANYGGRFDFIARIAKRIAIVDVKTGSYKESHRLQLAAYAAAQFIGRPGDEKRYPLPKIRDYYVLLLREGAYELVGTGPAATTKIIVGPAERRHFLTLAKTYNAAKCWEGKK